MDNCGISFGNDLKYVAEGDSFNIHFPLSISRRSLPDKWQFANRKGNTAMSYYFAPMEGITDSVYRRIHHRFFGGVDRYFMPFLSPTVHRELTPRESRELPSADSVPFLAVPQLLTKVPAGADWVIADMMGEEKISPEAWSLVQDNIRAYVRDASNLGNVFAGLAATGYAMQVYGTSRPASGFEHLCSHVWEMEKLSVNGEEVSHGFKAGFGSLVSTLLIEYMLEHSAQEIASKAAAPESVDERRKNIEKLLEKGCYGDKVLPTAMSKFKSGDDILSRRREILDKWESFKAPVRDRLIPFAELREMLKKAGCPWKPEMIGLDKAQLTGGVRRAQLIRVRYNIADLLYEAGVLEDAIKKLDVLFE